MSLNIANRLNGLRQSLIEKEIDGILVSQPENRYYLSGFDGSAGYLLITPQDTILATDFRYVEQVKLQAPDYQIFQITNNTADWFPQPADRNIASNRIMYNDCIALLDTTGIPIRYGNSDCIVSVNSAFSMSFSNRRFWSAQLSRS